MICVEMSQQLRDIENFRREFEQLKQQYALSKSPEDLVSGIRRASENPSYRHFGQFFFHLGNSYMGDGDLEAGAACMKAALDYFSYVDHHGIFYLRMAQYHIEKGDPQAGVGYLVRLCTEVKNLEVHMAAYDLTEVWEKYRRLYALQLPERTPAQKQKAAPEPEVPQPKQPSECGQTVEQILQLGEDDLLSSLSQHLDELSGYGEALNRLNRWERCVYYADEVCREVNSGGFEGYLYYHGTHIAKAQQAFAQINAKQALSLTEQIARKFPGGSVPKSEGAIQNAMDQLEEREIDFEDEDAAYYSTAEREILDCLVRFVRENQNHFR